MNATHLKVQLLDCKPEEIQEQQPRVPTNIKLFDPVQRHLKDIYTASFAPNVLSTTFTAIFRSYRRLVRSSSDLLLLGNSGQWTVTAHDVATATGTALVLRHFDELFEHQQQRISKKLTDRIPQQAPDIMRLASHSVAAFRQTLRDTCHSQSFAKMALATIPFVPEFDKESYNERDLVVINGQLHAVAPTGLTAITDAQQHLESHQRFELQIPRDQEATTTTSKLPFEVRLLNNQSDSTALAAFRSILATALLANRHVPNLVVLLSGSSQKFLHSLQRLSASHSSASVPIVTIAGFTRCMFDDVAFRHIPRISIFDNEVGAIVSRYIKRMDDRPANTLKIIACQGMLPQFKLPVRTRVLHLCLSPEHQNARPAALLQWLIGGLYHMHDLSHIVPVLQNTATLQQRAVQDIVAQHVLDQAYAPTHSSTNSRPLVIPIRSLVKPLKMLTPELNRHVSQHAIATALEQLHFSVTRPQNVPRVLVYCKELETPATAP